MSANTLQDVDNTNKQTKENERERWRGRGKFDELSAGTRWAGGARHASDFRPHCVLARPPRRADVHIVDFLGLCENGEPRGAASDHP